MSLRLLPCLLVSFLALGCPSQKPEDTGAISVDADGDGLFGTDDCDDGDPAMGGPSTWYEDADGDAFGDPTSTNIACDPIAGFIADSTDCDDADPEVYPGADEHCDAEGQDEDCDGLPDDIDAQDRSTFYEDRDGDGHGDAASTDLGCVPGDGWVVSGDDCEDGAATVYPGAVEVCDNLDNDCDPLSTEAGIVTLDGQTSFTSIQEAVDAASTGSTLVVCPGTFVGAVEVGADIHIEGLAGADPGEMVISSDGTGPALLVSSGAVILENLAFSGGIGAAFGKNAETVGGVISAAGASSLTLSLCTVTGGLADFGGGIFGPIKGDLSLSSVTVSGNTANISGGGVYGHTVYLTDVIIQGNSAVYGGGGCAVADWSGAGIDISENTAEKGGGVYLQDASTLMGEGDVGNNEAQYGGGVYMEGNGYLHEITITDNLASEDGGGLYSRSDASLDGPVFEGNTAVGNGGGIFATGTIDLSTVELSHNAADMGAGLVLDTSTASLADCTVSDNEAASQGGGALVYDSTLVLLNTVFDANSAGSSATGGYGGGLMLQLGHVEADNLSVIRDNEAFTGGGGVFVYEEGTMTGIRIEANSALNGAGVFCSGATTLAGVTLSQNVAVGWGGALYTEYPVEMSTSVVEGNTAAYGAGIYVYTDVELLLSESSIISNVASTRGGGLRLNHGFMESVLCDWGSKATENSPDDVYTHSTAYTAYGAAASFTCDENKGCF